MNVDIPAAGTRPYVIPDDEVRNLFLGTMMDFLRTAVRRTGRSAANRALPRSPTDRGSLNLEKERKDEK